ncbi:enoyl-CoA hydratase-related protein [Actinomadura sp. DC4]|uniref:enoyl-CoA hydratase-related protein n=1 Tax=Actinomadura sp. DC4 TaxID=3055069 RepID=UPI0025B221E7|nr:enoyl-CoA hydratase-related protein [Actinomadura sp. DC4]MDN3354263.1 enoyl-CoA hydratase-related protein [Actinomadura sp. DC4]
MAAGPVADATWVRLDVGGPLDAATARRLLDGLRAAEADPACRAVVLAADGPVFCTGMDLSGLDEPGDVVWELLTALAGGRLASVAVVEGSAVGGGVGVAAACDFVFAGPDASFRLTELLLGLVPALIMPFVTARTGEHGMLRMSVLAERHDAEAARGIGLVDEAGERPWESVRRVLLALRRMPSADLVGELKACRRRLHPLPADYPEHARRVLRRRVADPAVRARIERLRAEGVLT